MKIYALKINSSCGYKKQTCQEKLAALKLEMFSAVVFLLITSLSFVFSAVVPTIQALSISEIITDIDKLTINVMSLKDAIAAVPMKESEVAIATTNVQTALSELVINVQDLKDTVTPSESNAILAKLTTLQQEVIETISLFDTNDVTLVGSLVNILSPLLQNALNLLNNLVTGLQTVDPSLGTAALGLKNEIVNKATSILLASPFLHSVARGLGHNVA